MTAVANTLLAFAPPSMGTRQRQSLSAKRRVNQQKRSMDLARMEEVEADYKSLVAENRMITIKESNIRYAGALFVLLLAIYDYVGMQGAGVFDYNKIAAGAAGAWLLFQSGRQSF